MCPRHLGCRRCRRFGVGGTVLLVLGMVFPGPRLRADEPAAADSPAAKAAAQVQEIRQLLVTYHAAKPGSRHGAATIKKLAELGPDGVAAAKNVLEKELRKAESQVPKRPSTASCDKDIDKLRKTLADLRKDPQLTHEQLEKTGLPALEQLRTVFDQRAALLAPYHVKAANTVTQLQQFADLLHALQTEWKQQPPLPLQDYLSKTEKLIAGMTTPDNESHRKIYAENEKLASKLDKEIVKGMEAVNRIRVMCGLNPLVYDLKLCAAAEGHSKDMERLNFFSHESPVPGKRTMMDRAQLAGTTASGENIHMGSDAVDGAIKGWFLSPGHHKNMLNEGQRRQGLGRANKRWTQEFGT